MNDYKMIAIDLDGTLLTDNKTISLTNMRALLDAMKAGVRICISTGRAWPGARQFVRQIGPDTPVITSNGAMIVNPVNEDIIFEQTLNKSVAAHIYELGNDIGVSQIVWSRNILYGNRIDHYLCDYGQRFGKMEPRQITDFSRINEDGILKILWYDTPEKIEEYRKYLNLDSEDVTVCTSNAEFLEFFSPKVSKAEGLSIISSMYKITPTEVIAVGDGSNDIEMLKWAGLGVAMGNASEYVKSQADLVTDTNENDGVAKMILQVLAV